MLANIFFLRSVVLSYFGNMYGQLVVALVHGNLEVGIVEWKL